MKEWSERRSRYGTIKDQKLNYKINQKLKCRINQKLKCGMKNI